MRVQFRLTIAATLVAAAFSLEHLSALPQTAGLAELKSLGLESASLRLIESTVGDRQLDASARVSQRFEATPIKNVLNAIGTSTGLKVRFDQRVPEAEKPFTGQLTDLSLDAALARVFTGSALAFTVTGAKSVFVYSDTLANRQRLTESIRVFRIAKADPAVVTQTLTADFRTSRPDGLAPMVVANRTPALVIVRATADKMDAAAAFIAAKDK